MVQDTTMQSRGCVGVGGGGGGRNIADLVKLRQPVCTDAGCGKGIMQGLHQAAPAFLIRHMLH